MAALYESRRRGGDLTPVLKFALGAVEAGCPGARRQDPCPQ